MYLVEHGGHRLVSLARGAVRIVARVDAEVLVGDLHRRVVDLKCVVKEKGPFDVVLLNDFESAVVVDLVA